MDTNFVPVYKNTYHLIIQKFHIKYFFSLSSFFFSFLWVFKYCVQNFVTTQEFLLILLLSLEYNISHGLVLIFVYKHNLKKEMIGLLWQKNHIFESKFPTWTLVFTLLTKTGKYSSSHSSFHSPLLLNSQSTYSSFTTLKSLLIFISKKEKRT